jgi:hypothetical protein
MTQNLLWALKRGCVKLWALKRGCVKLWALKRGCVKGLRNQCLAAPG